MIAHGSAVLVELLDGLLQSRESLVVVELALNETNTLRELCPHVIVEGRARIAFDRVVDDLLEVLGLPVATRKSDECEPGRQKATVREIVDGRHQFFAREVTGHPEDDQPTRSRYAIESAIGRESEGVEIRADFDRGHTHSLDDSFE